MNKRTASVSWWILALLFTLSIAIYQRLTGPTYPVRGSINIEGEQLKYRLIRSSNSDRPAEVTIDDVPEELSGTITYKRFKIDEALTTVSFSREEDKLIAFLPAQPPAGKLEYTVQLNRGDQAFTVNDTPVVIRFKGPVPDFILIPHILLMFLAMLFSTRTGIEAVRQGSHLLTYTGLTLLFLLLGGMLLGPVVQKYAFDDFWTGWPFGQDMTDNKTLVAFVAWIIAYVRIRKDKKYRWWAVAAAIILLAVYLIPHSMFGSELDYSTGTVKTGE